MEAKTIIKLATVSVVAVILVGAFLIPIISDSADPKYIDVTPAGYYPMKDYTADSDGTYTLSWVQSTNRILNVNGVEFNPYATYGNRTTFVVIADDWMMSFESPGDGWLQFRDFGNDVSRIGKSMTLTASEGNATITVGEFDETTTTYTTTYTTMRAIDLDATGLKMTPTPYVRMDTEVMAAVTSTISGNTACVILSGSIENGFTATFFGTNVSVLSAINVVVDYAATEYDGIYQINKITYDVYSTSTSSVVKSLTNSYFIAPVPVLVEEPALLGSESAMLHAIPLFAIVGILAACMATILFRRDD